MTMQRIAFIVLIATIVVPSKEAYAAPASLVTFVFGDSLTDVGNNNYLRYSLARSNYPWYGIDYVGRQATGRFCNGRTVGDIISEKLGIPPPPPYLSLAQGDDAILNGVNYASGGAGILNDTGLYFRLHKLGARTLIFHGLGPLGCIPSQRVKSKKGECLKQVNLWMQQFNSRVNNLIVSLNRHLPNAQFAFADAYPAVLDLIQNPHTYGFKISNTSCCNVDTSIGGLCLPNSKLCTNRSEYVFWDAFHPSDAANAVLADKLFNSLFASPPAPPPVH
ncbi:GDSL lipase/esterase [Dillenia turbinata]|uniref:GDSL lipase/esterase n=1 Tax=Dillenia turbinata TaxID=194707 RepID=A0AAN8VDF7_9MAGN